MKLDGDGCKSLVDSRTLTSQPDSVLRPSQIKSSHPWLRLCVWLARSQARS